MKSQNLASQFEGEVSIQTDMEEGYQFINIGGVMGQSHRRKQAQVMLVGMNKYKMIIQSSNYQNIIDAIREHQSKNFDLKEVPNKAEVEVSMKVDHGRSKTPKVYRIHISIEKIREGLWGLKCKKMSHIDFFMCPVLMKIREIFR